MTVTVTVHELSPVLVCGQRRALWHHAPSRRHGPRRRRGALFLTRRLLPAFQWHLGQLERLDPLGHPWHLLHVAARCSEHSQRLDRLEPRRRPAPWDRPKYLALARLLLAWKRLVPAWHRGRRPLPFCHVAFCLLPLLRLRRQHLGLVVRLDPP